MLYQESQPVLMAKLNESTLNLNRKYDLVKKIAERSGALLLSEKRKLIQLKRET